MKDLTPFFARIESSIYTPGFAEEGAISLALEDIIVNSLADAKEAVEYMVHGFDFFIDDYE